MTSDWLDERPRRLSVPLPTPMHSAARTPSSKSGREDTLKALREKLSEFQAENNLLGTLVKELKAERDGLQKRLLATQKQHNDASSKAATAVQQVDAAGRDQKRLASEVERLSSVVHSHSVRLQKAKAHQQELEDVALDLRAELDEVRAKQEAAEQAAAAAAQRATAAEAKLEAAGLGAMPKMGPTAEQLVINSTQRIRELSEELASLRSESEQKLAGAQQQLQHNDQQWQQQLDAVKASAQEQQQRLEQQLQRQTWELEQQTKRSQECEQQCRSLQQQLLQSEYAVSKSKHSSQAVADLERSRQALFDTNQALQQQVAQLQQQLMQRDSNNAVSNAEQQHRMASLQREKQELAASLAAIRQAETAHRLSTAEASSKVERLRGELLRCVGELQAQLAASASTGQQQQQMQQQLRALEATAAAARAEAAESRQQLVELASVTLAELREQVAGEAVAITGLPEDVGGALPAPVVSYIKVLEHAVYDCERRSKQLLEDALAAQQHERDARQALASAREAQAAAERALQQQTQRLLAAERMRLTDLKEQQSLERRLGLAQQECANLRNTLLNRSGNDSSWQQQLGALAGFVEGAAAAECWSPTAAASGAAAASPQGSPNRWDFTGLSLTQQSRPSPTRAAGDASSPPGPTGVSGLTWQQQQQQSPGGISAAAASKPNGPGSNLPQPQEQQQQQWGGQVQGVQQEAAPPQPQQQQQQQGLWQLPAADAGQAAADVSASNAASIGRYQAKLAQLRQLKEQLMRKTYGDASHVADTTTATPLIGAQGGSQQQDGYTPQQQQVPQLRPAAPVGAAPVSDVPVGVWTPRSAQGDWLIGTGNQGGVLSTSGTSMDHTSTCSAYSAGGAGGSAAAADSSSGGGSLLSAWSGQGKGAAAGRAAVSGGQALGSGSRETEGPAAPLRLSRHSVSLHKSSAASNDLIAEHHRELQQQVQGAHSSPAAAAAPAGDMKQWVRAVSNAASLDAAAAAAAAGGGAGCDRGAQLQGRSSSSLRRSSSSLKETSRHSLREAGGASAKELPGGSYRSSAASTAAGSGGEGGVAPHGLSSKSHLQRWAQPQTQQQQQQPVWQRQSSDAASSRRVTGSGRSSLV